METGSNKELSPLERFALAALEEHRNWGCCDLDGGWLQDKAEELGLLVRVEVSESCDEEGANCSCAEYGDFPQECLRYAEFVREKLRSTDKTPAEAGIKSP